MNDGRIFFPLDLTGSRYCDTDAGARFGTSEIRGLQGLRERGTIGPLRELECNDI